MDSGWKMWAAGPVALFAYYAWTRYLHFRRVQAQVGFLPGYITFLDHTSVLNNLLQRPRWLFLGNHVMWEDKYSTYDRAGCNIISAVSMWPKAKVSVFVADPVATKEISLNRICFPKPLEVYESLNIFGRNLLVSEGQEWKNHRKISAPAFSERNNQLVWDATAQIALGFFRNTWGDRKEIVVDHCLDVTTPMALQVICAAAFGRKNADNSVPPGHELSFYDTVKTVSEDVFLYLVAGTWCPNITKRIRKVRLAYKELGVYMSEMIAERRMADEKGQSDRYDLFSNLIDASNDEDNPMSDEDVMGNIFIFLFAGHETTAHTLCFAIALLALYQDEQEKLYEQCVSLISKNEIPTYQQMGTFTRALAVFYEALRLFPAVLTIPKVCAEDTVIVTTNHNGDKVEIPLLKGDPVMLSATGMHYNPKYWEDPGEFKPDRFFGQWNRDAFVPFSAGLRSCIGRKFAETEGVAILVLMVQRYRISVTEEPHFAYETFEQKKERVLKCYMGLTITPSRVPLTFRRRD